MIPKGLKVGDKYEYYGFTYEVLEVVGDYYNSKRVGTSSPSFTDVEQPKAETKEDNDYLSMPYAQLKKLCAERGLDATGKKEDLIARLEG